MGWKCIMISHAGSAQCFVWLPASGVRWLLVGLGQQLPVIHGVAVHGYVRPNELCSHQSLRSSTLSHMGWQVHN
eukprot:1160255-Pelagomonas_calceolata.AAC.9